MDEVTEGYISLTVGIKGEHNLSIKRALGLICIASLVAAADVPEWLAKELAKIGGAELKFIGEELEEGSFIFANGVGKKERYLFFKDPLSVGHVGIAYLVKNGALAEVSIKTSRTISILQNVELDDSVANVLPITRLKEVCDNLTQKKITREFSCEGRIGTVFAKAKLMGEKNMRVDLYLSTAEPPSLENSKTSPGKFGLGKPNSLVIDKETLSIPFEPSSAHFWILDFQETTAKQLELKVKFPEKIDARKLGKGMRRIDDRQFAMDFGLVGERFGAEFGIDPTDQEGPYSMKLVGGGRIYGAVAYTISKEQKKKK